MAGELTERLYRYVGTVPRSGMVVGYLKLATTVVRDGEYEGLYERPSVRFSVSRGQTLSVCAPGSGLVLFANVDVGGGQTYFAPLYRVEDPEIVERMQQAVTNEEEGRALNVLEVEPGRFRIEIDYYKNGTRESIGLSREQISIVVNALRALLGGSVEGVEAPLTLGGGCSHKFVDSRHCLKCGWEPPLAGAKSEGE
jgi:hypothetical protein